jgi:hypothetical protein
MQTEGGLTYFNYYFEAMSTIAQEEAAPGRSKLTLGLVGAGVVAATVVSGLVIGDVWQKSQAPEDGQPKDASLKQDAAKNSPQANPAVPEQQNVERSRPNPTPSPQNRPAIAPRKTSARQPDPLLSPPAMPPAPAIAAPETLATTPVLPAPTPVVPRSNTTNPQTSAWVTANIPQMSVAEAARRQAALTTVTQPERLPPTAARGIPANAPGTPLPPTDNAANPTPLPPPTLGTAAPDQARVEAINPATNSSPIAENGPSPGTLSSTPNAVTPGNGNGLQRLFPPSAQLEGRDRVATVTPEAESMPPGINSARSTASSLLPETASQPGVTQRLQDYLTLPQKSPDSPAVSLLPLSQQAAAEAGNTGQVGQFTVRQVNPQEYQQEWLASNKSTEDPAIALAFPAYGFIDYQRQVIVVLKDQPSTPLQSQRTTAPRSREIASK